MKYRIQVDMVFTDMVRFPGEASQQTRVYDIEAQNIFEAHDAARTLVDGVKRQCFPIVDVEVTRQRLLGLVCGHCIGTGMEEQDAES